MPYVFRNYWYMIVVMILIYAASLAFNIYILTKCSFTDPGIIPAITSKFINKKKKYCTLSYN